jgi:VWFA-related protein
MLHPLRRRADAPVLTIWCLLLIAGCLPGNAQRGGSGSRTPDRSPTKSTYTIPVTVRRVVLDVVVTDSQHNAVRGLTSKDFSVTENNKPQTVRSFEEVDFDANPTFVAPKLPPLPPDTYVNVATEPERGPLYVIVYDAVHMEGFNPMSETDQGDQIQARKQLANFLANKPAGTRFALFLLADDFRLLQGFTTDPNKLLQAFDVHRKEGHIPWNLLNGANLGRDDTDMPFEVMTFISHYLEGLPGRKNLIWMSSEFPQDVPMIGVQAAVVGNTMSAGAGSPLQAQGFSAGDNTTLGDSWSMKIMRRAVDSLNAAQVAVYPVDVSGLKVNKDGIDTLAQHIADATGGQAYYNTNDISGAIMKATENGSNYYEISYAPTDFREDSKMRGIRVSLDRKGYNLEYRRYYYAEDPEKPLWDDEKRVAVAVQDQVVAHLPGDSMYAYMQHGAPVGHDVVFRAQFHAGPAAMATPDQMANLVEQPAYFVVRKSNKPMKLPAPIPLRPYTIDYLVLDQKAASQPGGQVLEFAAGAYDRNGKLLNGISQNAVRTQTATPGNGGQRPFFRAVQTLEVPTTAAWLRVAVRDVATDRIGTMEIPLPLATDGQAVASGSGGSASLVNRK